MRWQRKRIHQTPASASEAGAVCARPLARRPSTVGELVARALRVVVLAALVVLLVVGVLSLIGGSNPGAGSAARETVRPAWPDDEARAFAIGFARAYATFGPDYQESHQRALEPYLSDELRSSTLVQLPDSGPPQRVTGAIVARTVLVARERALVTVALTIEQRTITTRYLAVPVRRQRQALVVDDLPSWSPPPAKAAGVEEPALEEIPSADRTAIRGVLERFLPPFLAGRSDELDYLEPADRRVAALAQGYAFLELVSFAQEGVDTDRTRTVLAVVRARDQESEAVYTLRYRLALRRGPDGRWLVADLNTTTGGRSS